MMTNVSRAWFAGLSLLMACAEAEGVTATDASVGSSGGSRNDAALTERAGTDLVDGTTSVDAFAAGGASGGAVSDDGASPVARDAPTTDVASTPDAQGEAQAFADARANLDASLTSDDGARIEDVLTTSDTSPPSDHASPTDGATGAADTGPSDAVVAAGRLVVTYRATSAAQLQFDVHVNNTGTQSPPTRSVVVRYYLTTESVPRASDIFLDSAAWQSTTGPIYYLDLLGSCTATYAPINGAASDGSAGGPAAPDAAASDSGPDAYIDVTCAVDQPLLPGASLNVQVRVTGSNPTNDYSYQPGANVAPNARIVVLQNGVVVAGTPPP